MVSERHSVGPDCCKLLGPLFLENLCVYVWLAESLPYVTSSSSNLGHVSALLAFQLADSHQWDFPFLFSIIWYFSDVPGIYGSARMCVWSFPIEKLTQENSLLCKIGRKLDFESTV